ncbi:WD domain containing protein [Diplocarpon rosae]|nr:WD domain containing protein [Diplocarpon rosae]
MAAMAVKDESLHYATEDLILPFPRRHYRAKIDTSHWQLRSLISSPEQNVIYFPHGTNIFSINTKTRQRELVASLSFPPRCLVASKDWLCCGGDTGSFSAISLKPRSMGSEISSFWSADPDSRLPLDLDPTRRLYPREQDSSARLRDNWHFTRPFSESDKIGSEIVNCVTLWFPSGDVSERAYKSPVAVVSNNDCSVSILDLRTSDILHKLTLPDLVNRSAISPDGELLVSICDDPFLYVHKRSQKVINAENFESVPTPVYDWVMAGRIQLESQRQADKSQMRGSFALCFSKSGKFLAVATQYGIISVFDAERLTDTQSLIVSFTTSRPSRQPGAVRAMDFSPGPYDLLAWTEARGRIGVADVRTLFHSRQLILINTNDQNVETIPIADRSNRLSGLRGDEALLTHTDDFQGFQSDRRQSGSLMREIDRHRTSSTIDEDLDVLRAHRIDRQRRDAHAAREGPAEAVSSRTAFLNTSRRSTPSVEARPGIATGQRLPSALREFVYQERTGTGVLQAFIDERNRDSERRASSNHVSSASPRQRESSMVFTAAEAPNERDTNITSHTFETLSLTPSRRPSLGTDSPRAPQSLTPWAEVESLYLRARPAAPPERLRAPVIVDEEQNANPREFAHRLRQPWWRESPEEAVSFLSEMVENGRLNEVLRSAETMGICWSPDGSVLYAATLEGIHEYHVNISGRKRFPSITYQ